MPFNWLMFHLELDKGEGVVRISECHSLGCKMGMNEEKVRVALEFLNKAALVLYYPEDVPDLVLTNMDPFTNRLSRLIKASFLPPDKEPTKESEELRNKGVFTENIPETSLCRSRREPVIRGRVPETIGELEDSSEYRRRGIFPSQCIVAGTSSKRIVFRVQVNPSIVIVGRADSTSRVVPDSVRRVISRKGRRIRV